MCTVYRTTGHEEPEKKIKKATVNRKNWNKEINEEIDLESRLRQTPPLDQDFFFHSSFTAHLIYLQNKTEVASECMTLWVRSVR